MIRKLAFSLAFLIATTLFTADASGQERRRPVTNPRATIEGVVAAVSADGFRVQTPAGTVAIALTPATEIVRTAETTSAATPALGDYTFTDAIVGKDGSVTATRVALFTVPASVAAGETIRIEGKVAAVSPEASELKLETPMGAVLTVSTNETTLIRRDGTAIGLKDVAVGSIARVIGKPTGERTLLALEIDIRTAQQPPHRDGVAGEVVEVRAAERTLVVRRVMSGPRPAVDELAIVKTDDRTEIYRRRERIRFEEIKTGDFVLAQGEFDAAKALLASRIDVADMPEPAPMFAGRVLDVLPATRQFTVAVERGWPFAPPDGPVTVVVTDTTKIYRDREQVRFDAIKPGDFVHVAGQLRDDKAVVASVVHLVTLPVVPPMPALLGEIVEIEAATRTLIVRVRAMRPMENANDGTVKVLVGDETTIFRNGQPSRFAELKVGEVASVIGEVREDRAILAKRIDVLAVPQRPGHVAGDVSAVGERSIEIIVPTINPTFQPVRVMILVEEATEIYRDGARVRLSAIQVNDVLMASGEWKDDSTFGARRIDARSRPQSPVAYVRGTIRTIAPGELRLVDPDGQLWGVSVSPLTIIIRDGLPLRFESLVVGDQLDVIGVSKGDHSIAAVTIRVVR